MQLPLSLLRAAVDNPIVRATALGCAGALPGCVFTDKSALCGVSLWAQLLELMSALPSVLRSEPTPASAWALRWEFAWARRSESASARRLAPASARHWAAASEPRGVPRFFLVPGWVADGHDARGAFGSPTVFVESGAVRAVSDSAMPAGEEFMIFGSDRMEQLASFTSFSLLVLFLCCIAFKYLSFIDV